MCPSANCTWDPFYTLGLCNECNSITVSPEWRKVNCSDSDAAPLLNGQNCTKYMIITPSNMSLPVIFGRSNTGADDVSTYLTANTTTRSLNRWFDNSFPSQSMDTLALLAFARLPLELIKNYATHLTDIRQSTEILECRITWCAKRYKDVKVVRISTHTHFLYLC